MKITDEMIEAGGIAIANAAGSMITEFKGQSADFTELRRKQSKACLEAALQTKLTEADKLLEVRPTCRELERIMHKEYPFEISEVYSKQRIFKNLAITIREYLKSYKAGRE